MRHGDPPVRRGAAALATAAVLAAVCGTAPPPTPAAGGRLTALMGGRVLPSPQAAVIPEASRLPITAVVESRSTTRTPRSSAPTGPAKIGFAAGEIVATHHCVRNRLALSFRRLPTSWSV